MELREAVFTNSKNEESISRKAAKAQSKNEEKRLLSHHAAARAPHLLAIAY